MERVALVTGAARGIGAEITRTLSVHGATVVRADVLPAHDWERVDGGEQVRLDVSDAISCQDAVAAVVDLYGRLDILVNNAGIQLRAGAREVDIADWNRVLDVNLTGTLRMCQAAFPALRVRGGAIVNLGSTNGQVAVPNSAAYCVSKAGVLHLTRVLALEWAPHQIRVNAVGPTIVATDMTADVRADPAYLEDKLASIPLGRMATSADVAAAVAYLASPAAAMVTGQTLFVDGGVTIH